MKNRIVKTYNPRRPRAGGDPVTFVERHWIPAFAGMTAHSIVVPAQQLYVQRLRYKVLETSTIS